VLLQHPTAQVAASQTEVGDQVAVPRMAFSSASASCLRDTGLSGQKLSPEPSQPSEILSRASCSIQRQKGSFQGTSSNLSPPAVHGPGVKATASTRARGPVPPRDTDDGSEPPSAGLLGPPGDRGFSGAVFPSPATRNAAGRDQRNVSLASVRTIAPTAHP
jgi:hypothetical protein